MRVMMAGGHWGERRRGSRPEVEGLAAEEGLTGVGGCRERARRRAAKAAKRIAKGQDGDGGGRRRFADDFPASMLEAQERNHWRSTQEEEGGGAEYCYLGEGGGEDQEVGGDGGRSSL